MPAACNNEPARPAFHNKFIVTEENGQINVRSRDGSLHISGNEKADQLSIKGSPGNGMDIFINNEGIADNFPPDIPLYTESRVTKSRVFRNTHAAATLISEKPVSDIVTFYKTSLPDKGWLVEKEINLGEMVLLDSKKNNKNLHISIIEKQKSVKITLAMTISKEPQTVTAD
ncbi:MAG: hypothetical protein GY868_07265 [Deltaproteobacteria bacterium]|nr:hypothetical protein [Deltaproteobacteria bacterium]